jgi:hypothetical protein
MSQSPDLGTIRKNDFEDGYRGVGWKSGKKALRRMPRKVNRSQDHGKENPEKGSPGRRIRVGSEGSRA